MQIPHGKYRRPGADLSKMLPVAITQHSGKLALAIQVVMAANTVHEWTQQQYNAWRTSRDYTIRLEERDDIYPDVQRWIFEHLPEERRRRLLAITRRRDMNGIGDSESSRDELEVRYYYDESSTTDIMVDGHKVSVFIDKDEGEENKNTWAKNRLVFTASNLVGQRAVMGLLKRIADEHSLNREPHLHTIGGWGGWLEGPVIPKRPLSSVVLGDGIMEKLNDDLGTFLANEERYGLIGLPYRRAYLLYGPPGTGKTSAVRALAREHRMDVYYLPLADLKADVDLANLTSQIDKRSILLIEDVDISHAATSRKEEDKVERVSAGGLLNTLDGMITPHGLVAFMTTNNRELLDEALTRKGRTDVSLELGYLTQAQAEQLVRVMTGIDSPLPPIIPGYKITAAEITGIIKQHIVDPREAYVQVCKFLGG